GGRAASPGGGVLVWARWAMKGWVIWLGLLVCIGALADSQKRERETPAPAAQVVTEPAPAPPAPAEAVKAQAEQTWVPVRVAARNLSVISLQAIPLVLLLGGIGWGVRRRDMWYPRKEDGAMPFRGVLNGVAERALEARHTAELAEASQVLPVHTYAPHTTYAPHDTYSPRKHQSGEWVEPPAAVVSVDKTPTWAELVARGEIGPGRPLYLGRAPDKPLTGSWKSVYSAGIGGLTGSGKSWTAVSLILQALGEGARVYVIDPHDGDPESLGSRLRPVEHLLARAGRQRPGRHPRGPRGCRTRADAADPRLPGPNPGAGRDRRAHRAPARRAGDVISRVIEAVNQEGRKLLLTCLLLGQSWSVRRTGSSDVRGTLTSAFVHRMPGATARQLTNLRAEELPRDTMQLAPGECYVVTTTGEITHVVTPRLTLADVTAFAALLTSAVTSGPAAGDFPATSAGLSGSQAEVTGKSSGSQTSAAETAGQDPDRERDSPVVRGRARSS
ncbi:MAG: helicase HerA domain-containing protein, partial [Egibacteraceae bacterium]